MSNLQDLFAQLYAQLYRQLQRFLHKRMIMVFLKSSLGNQQ